MPSNYFNRRSDGLMRRRHRIDQAARKRLVDAAIERYVEWREESATVDEAYGNWSNAPAAEGAVCFAAYRAALDREERAATLYGAVMDQLQRRWETGREFAAPAQA